MHLRPFRSLLIALAMSLGAPALAAPAKIGKIDVVGNHRIEKDAILEKMSLKAGQNLDPARIKADILSIFSMGFFEDISLEQEGSTLIVRVRERPVVTKITYIGAEEFETKDMEEATGLKPFNVL